MTRWTWQNIAVLTLGVATCVAGAVLHNGWLAGTGSTIVAYTLGYKTPNGDGGPRA